MLAEEKRGVPQDTALLELIITQRLGDGTCIQAQMLVEDKRDAARVSGNT